MNDQETTKLAITVAFGLLVTSGVGFLAMAIHRFSPTKMPKKVSVLIAGAIAGVLILAVVKSGLPGLTAARKWATAAVLISAPIAWMALMLTVWFSIQRSLGGLASRQDDQQQQLSAAKANRETQSRDRDDLVAQVKTLGLSLEAAQKHAEVIAWLRDAVDLIHLESGKMVTRWSDSSSDHEARLRKLEETVDVGSRKTVEGRLAEQQAQLESIAASIEEHRRDISGIKNFLSPLPPPDPDAPNWNDVVDLDQIELWRAVSLTFDRDPDKLPGARDGRADLRRQNSNRNEWKYRLELAESHLGFALPVATMRDIDGSKRTSAVRLVVFAKWAIEREFPNLPRPLKMLAAAQLGPPPPP